MAALVIAPHLYKNVTYDTLKSFAPVGRVGDLPLVLVVNPSLPAKTLPELIAYAKSNPDKLTHLLGQQHGEPHRHGGAEAGGWNEDRARPLPGAVPRDERPIAGTVQVALDTVAVTRPHIEAGRLRLIGSAAWSGSLSSPTPTIAEQGYPGFEANAWLGMLPQPAHRRKRSSGSPSR